MYSSHITSSFLKTHIIVGNFCIQRNVETGCELKKIQITQHILVSSLKSMNMCINFLRNKQVLWAFWMIFRFNIPFTGDVTSYASKCVIRGDYPTLWATWGYCIGLWSLSSRPQSRHRAYEFKQVWNESLRTHEGWNKNQL